MCLGSVCEDDTEYYQDHTDPTPIPVVTEIFGVPERTQIILSFFLLNARCYSDSALELMIFPGRLSYCFRYLIVKPRNAGVS
jgi:hypothetical protein